MNKNLPDPAYALKMLLWEEYDPYDDLIYPTVRNWDDLLTATVKNGSYDTLTKDEVLSMLFGLIHRNRIVEGLWRSMFERGVTHKLLKRLSMPDTNEY